MQYYEEIDAILGHRAASQPTVLLSSVSSEDGEATLHTVEEGNEDFENDVDEGTYCVWW